ncbi:MAG TPA: hypothetical protein VJ044_08520, partial [Candidatus Hodarchaeales archaeon]|nr:hypothetical protein [Candidatus Hodarchaeales archaeon]
MPTYDFQLNEFNRLLPGPPATIEEITQKFPLMAVPVDAVDGEIISIEVFANRPDCLGVEGLARAFAGFTGRKTGLPRYQAAEDIPPFDVYVKPAMKNYRPYLAMAKVANLSLSEEAVKTIFTFQEKLHTTHCRNRRKASIGLYDIRAGNLEPPIFMKMAKVDEVSFLPLDETTQMTLGQVLRDTPKGREFSHLVPKDQVPLLLDNNGIVLSLIPILNANNSRVTAETTDLFVDCTGSDWQTMISAFNMMLTALIDRGGRIDPATIHYEYATPGGEEVHLPDFAPKSMTLDPAYVNKRLGVEL